MLTSARACQCGKISVVYGSHLIVIVALVGRQLSYVMSKSKWRLFCAPSRHNTNNACRSLVEHGPGGFSGQGCLAALQYVKAESCRCTGGCLNVQGRYLEEERKHERGEEEDIFHPSPSPHCTLFVVAQMPLPNTNFHVHARTYAHAFRQACTLTCTHAQICTYACVCALTPMYF